MGTNLWKELWKNNKDLRNWKIVMELIRNTIGKQFEFSEETGREFIELTATDWRESRPKSQISSLTLNLAAICLRACVKLASPERLFTWRLKIFKVIERFTWIWFRMVKFRTDLFTVSKSVVYKLNHQHLVLKMKSLQDF